MNLLFAGLLYQGMIIYADVIVSYNSTFTEQLETQKKVFQKLDSTNLEFKTLKCHFFTETKMY